MVGSRESSIQKSSVEVNPGSLPLKHSTERKFLLVKTIRVKKSALEKIKEKVPPKPKIIRVEQVVQESAPVVSRSALSRPYRCCWCFTIRVNQVDPHKSRCDICGHFGVTFLEEREIRNVYVVNAEDF